MAKNVLIFLLLGSQMALAMESAKCEGYLTKPIHTLINEIAKAHLDQQVIYQLRALVEPSSLNELDRWKKAVQQRRAKFNLGVITQDKDSVQVDFTLAGYGYDVIQAMMELVRPNPNSPVIRGALLWLKPHVSNVSGSRKPISVDNINYDSFLLSPYFDLNLPQSVINGLQYDRVAFVGDLVHKSEAQLMLIPNFGKKSLVVVREALENLDLDLGLNIPNWPPQDFDVVSLQFAESRLPVFTLAQWSERSFVGAANIFKTNSQGLGEAHPVAVVTEEDGRPMLAMIQYEYFVRTSAKELKGKLSKTKVEKDGLISRLNSWKQNLEGVRKLELSAIVGPLGRKELEQIMWSQEPLIVAGEGGRVIVIPIR